MGVKKLKSYSESEYIDGIMYDKSNRMQYHPEFHTRQSERFTSEDLEYLSMFYGIDKCRTLAFGLGKTESVITAKYNYLKRKGLISFYRDRYKRKFEAYDASERLSGGEL
jgi:hypothetical protein